MNGGLGPKGFDRLIEPFYLRFFNARAEGLKIVPLRQGTDGPSPRMAERPATKKLKGDTS